MFIAVYIYIYNLRFFFHGFIRRNELPKNEIVTNKYLIQFIWMTHAHSKYVQSPDYFTCSDFQIKCKFPCKLYIALVDMILSQTKTRPHVNIAWIWNEIRRLSFIIKLMRKGSSMMMQFLRYKWLWSNDLNSRFNNHCSGLF